MVSADEGFSLIEVLISLTIVVVVMGAVGTYTVRSVAFVSHQRAEQAASQLANSSLEQVRALRAVPVSGKPADDIPLVNGRGRAAVNAQFARAEDVVKPYLEQMEPAADADADADDVKEGESAAVSTETFSVTVDSVSYDRTIYLGECEVDMGTEEGRTGVCDKPNESKAADDDLTMYLHYYRAVVLVTWRNKMCALSLCSYVTSTLISKQRDSPHDTNRPSPVIKGNGSYPIYFYLNEATNYKIRVFGGTLPNKWPPLTVPDGLVAFEDGVVSGKPTRIMSVPFQGRVTDAQNRVSPPANLTFTVVAPPTVIAPAESKNHVGETVNVPVVSGGTPDFMKCSLSGQPTGVSFDGKALTGVYSGPVAGMQQQFTMQVSCTDRPRSIAGKTVSGTFKHTFYPSVQLAAPVDQKITLGSAINATATAFGGDQKFTYSAAAADLPTGVTINPTTGVVSGSPTVPGRYVLTVKVTDSIGGAGGQASKTFALVVETTSLVLKPVLNESDLTSTVNTPVAPRTFDTNAALLGLTTSVSAGGLPPGLTFNALTRTISGTPTTRGTYTVTLRATSVLPAASSIYAFLWTIK